MEAAGRGAEGVGVTNGRGPGLAAEVIRGRARIEAVRGEAKTDLTCDGMRRIALGEMALRRRRLGELTPEQECALESLLVSVADNINDLLSGVTAGAPRRARVEEACAPTLVTLGAVSPA